MYPIPYIIKVTSGLEPYAIDELFEIGVLDASTPRKLQIETIQTHHKNGQKELGFSLLGFCSDQLPHTIIQRLRLIEGLYIWLGGIDGLQSDVTSVRTLLQRCFQSDHTSSNGDIDAQQDVVQSSPLLPDNHTDEANAESSTSNSSFMSSSFIFVSALKASNHSDHIKYPMKHWRKILKLWRETTGIDIATPVQFRATGVRSGQHKFNRAELGAVTGDIVLENYHQWFDTSQTNIVVDLKEPTLELYSFVAESRLDLAIRFSSIDQTIRRHRPSMTNSDPSMAAHTSLRADIAACMVRLANLHIGDIVYDCMCGTNVLNIEALLGGTPNVRKHNPSSATIPISTEDTFHSSSNSSLMYTPIVCFGSEKSQMRVQGQTIRSTTNMTNTVQTNKTMVDTLNTTATNQTKSDKEPDKERTKSDSLLRETKRPRNITNKPCLERFVADASNLCIRTSCIDVVLVDPPYGRRCGSKSSTLRLIQKFIFVLARILRLSTGRAVLISPWKSFFSRMLHRIPYYSIENEFQVNNNGIGAYIYVLRRTDVPYRVTIDKKIQSGKAIEC